MDYDSVIAFEAGVAALNVYVTRDHTEDEDSALAPRLNRLLAGVVVAQMDVDGWGWRRRCR